MGKTQFTQDRHRFSDSRGHCEVYQEISQTLRGSVPTEPSLSRMEKMIRFQEVSKALMDQSFNKFTDATE